MTCMNSKNHINATPDRPMRKGPRNDWRDDWRLNDQHLNDPRPRRGNAAMISAMAACMMMPPLLLTGAPSASAAARPGPLETYKDWAIGCDNINHCTAASLVPQDGNLDGDLATLYIRRDAGPEGTLRLEIMLEGSHEGQADLLVDGVRHASASIRDAVATIGPDDNDRLIRAMVRGKTLSLWVKGRMTGALSLSGISAALRYMDARQGRAGTVTALVAIGRLGVGSVKAAPATPLIYHIPAPAQDKAPSRLWQGERSQALVISGCAEEQTPTSEAEITRLSDKDELVLIPCGAGAYNFSFVPLVATGLPGRRSFKLARFDYAPGWSEPGSPPNMVNASWNKEGGILSSYAKGRGIGDCGSMESYVWDGSVFRLVEKREMNICRGAWDWIRLWKAETAPITKDTKKAD